MSVTRIILSALAFGMFIPGGHGAKTRRSLATRLAEASDPTQSHPTTLRRRLNEDTKFFRGKVRNVINQIHQKSEKIPVDKDKFVQRMVTNMMPDFMKAKKNDENISPDKFWNRNGNNMERVIKKVWDLQCDSTPTTPKRRGSENGASTRSPTPTPQRGSANKLSLSRSEQQWLLAVHREAVAQKTRKTTSPRSTSGSLGSSNPSTPIPKKKLSMKYAISIQIPDSPKSRSSPRTRTAPTTPKEKLSMKNQISCRSFTLGSDSPTSSPRTPTAPVTNGCTPRRESASSSSPRRRHNYGSVWQRPSISKTASSGSTSGRRKSASSSPTKGSGSASSSSHTTPKRPKPIKTGSPRNTSGSNARVLNDLYRGPVSPCSSKYLKPPKRTVKQYQSPKLPAGAQHARLMHKLLAQLAPLYPTYKVDCPECGTGKTNQKTCERCSGSGKVNTCTRKARAKTDYVCTKSSREKVIVAKGTVVTILNVEQELPDPILVKVPTGQRYWLPKRNLELYVDVLEENVDSTVEITKGEEAADTIIYKTTKFLNVGDWSEEHIKQQFEKKNICDLVPLDYIIHNKRLHHVFNVPMADQKGKVDLDRTKFQVGWPVVCDKSTNEVHAVCPGCYEKRKKKKEDDKKGKKDRTKDKTHWGKCTCGGFGKVKYNIEDFKDYKIRVRTLPKTVWVLKKNAEKLAAEKSRAQSQR